MSNIIKKKGYLQKQSRFVKMWRKRWVVLQEHPEDNKHYLYTYEEVDEKNPTEVIQIDAETEIKNHSIINVVVENDADKNMFYIENKKSNEIFFFNAYSSSDRNEWIEAINNIRWIDNSINQLQKQRKQYQKNDNKPLLFHTEQLILHQACCIKPDSDENEQNLNLLRGILLSWQQKKQINNFRQKIISSTLKCIENDNVNILRIILVRCYKGAGMRLSHDQNEDLMCFINHASKNNSFDCIQLLLQNPSNLNWSNNFKNPTVLYYAVKYTQNKDLINFVINKLESLKICFICDDIMKEVIIKDWVKIAKRLVNNRWHKITKQDEEFAESIYKLKIITYFKQRSSVSAFRNNNNPEGVFALDIDDWELDENEDDNDDWDEEETCTYDNQEEWIKTLKTGYKLDIYNRKWLIGTVLNISDNGECMRVQYDLSKRIEEISLYSDRMRELHSETVSHNYIICHNGIYSNCGPICNAQHCQTFCSKCRLQICGICLGIEVDCKILCKDCFMKYEYKYIYDLAKLVLRKLSECRDIGMERNIGIMIVKYMALYICNECGKQINIIPQFSRGIIIEINEELVDLNYLKNYKIPQVSCGYKCTL
eukprot:63306_1